MALEQWVNLQKNSVYTKDGDGIVIDRCGEVKVEAMFLKDDIPISFKVKVTPVGSDNVKYTKKEIRRNPKFKLIKGRMGISDKKNVLLEESIQLPAAGGDKYKIEAKDSNGKVVASTMEVETRRKLYYEIIKMKGLSVPTSFAKFEDEYWSASKNYFIKLKNIGESIMSKIHNIGNQADQDRLVLEAKKVYKGKKYDQGPKGSKETLVAAVLFTDHLAVKEESPLLELPVQSSRVQGKDSAVSIAYASPGQGRMLHPLWRKIVPGDNSWFIEATFTDHNGGKHVLDYTTHVTEGPVSIGSDGISTIIFKSNCFPSSFFSSPTNIGKLSFKVNAVNRMRAGLALGDNNTIVICTKAWWRPTSNDEMFDVMIHELGHKVGMVPIGVAKGLDKTATAYTGQGHRGPHCQNGYTYNASSNPRWSDDPTGVKCVMYGSTNGEGEFCTVCGKALRKVDCDVRWSSIVDA